MTTPGEKRPVFAGVVTVGFGSVPALFLKVGISNQDTTSAAALEARAGGV